MADSIQDLAVAYQQSLDALQIAKDASKDARSSAENSFTGLVLQCSVDGDEAVKAIASAILYNREQISLGIEDPETGTKAKVQKVRDAAKNMRIAAKGLGDPKAAEAELSEAEDELDEAKGNLRDLKKAEKGQVKNLMAAFKGWI